jgi:hypothetical protein
MKSPTDRSLRETGFRSWNEDGTHSLTEDIQTDTEDYVTHAVNGVWFMAALNTGVDSDEAESIRVSLGYESDAHCGMTVEPDVARSIAQMLVRAADRMEQGRR